MEIGSALFLPMKIKVREWTKNKNSVSVNYGPLTYSLLIKEKYLMQDSKKTAIGDSKWQADADPAKWPTYEIYPASAWNYGLLLDKNDPALSFKVEKLAWPKDGNPFTDASAPIRLKAKGKQIAGWKIDQYGLCGLLPESPVNSDRMVTELTLVPMGGGEA